MLDRRIAQGLDCHSDKCRSATTHRAAHEQQARIKLDHRTELAKQIKHHGALLITKRGSLLASDDALAHRNRCVGHRRDMRDARQDLLPLALSQVQATDRTTFLARASLSGANTFSIMYGLTAATTISDAATTSAASWQATMPRASQRSTSAS